MSFLFNNNQPKVRQEGFHLPASSGSSTSQQPPSPSSNQFDQNQSSTMFFGQQIYPDAFRKYPGEQGNPMDFGDELASLMTTSPPDHNRRAPSEPQQHPLTNPVGPNSYDYRNPPHDIFGVQQFPTHFSLPHSRPSHLRDELVGAGPASQRDFYFDHHHARAAEFSPFGLQRAPQAQQHHPDIVDTPATSVSSDFQPGGRQSPASGVSRSRSRSKAATSRVRMPAQGKPQTQQPQGNQPHRASISSPSPPSPSTRPQAIVIPTAHQHHVNGNGLHTPSSTGAWFIPTHPNEGFGSTDNGAPQSFSAFAPQSLPLGTSPKSAKDNSPPPPPQDAAAKQAAIANEKRRRRRESHNAVERRRRDNINEKISELATLIPESMLDPTAKAEGSDVVGGGTLDDGDGKEPAAIKANKGMILRKSVDYIRYLQQLVGAQSTRNRELESQLSQYRGGAAPNGHSGTSSGSSSALHFGALGSEVDDTMAGLILAGSPDPSGGFDHHAFGLAGLPEETASFGDAASFGDHLAGPGLPHHHQHLRHHHQHSMDTSPSAAGSLEEDEEEEERGRGRGRGVNGVGTRRFGGPPVKEEDGGASNGTSDEDGKKMES